MGWSNTPIPTKKYKERESRATVTANSSAEAREPTSTKIVTDRVTRILDAVYEAADLDAIVSSYEHLDKPSKIKLLRLLKSKYRLFDGTLGTFEGLSVTLELLPGSTPVQCRPYPIPHSQRSTFQKELSRLMKLGVLIKNSDSPWASPSFLIPKKKRSSTFFN